jgi:hypothetical protein
LLGTRCAMTLAKRNKFNVCNATEQPRFQRASMVNGVSTVTARLNPRKPRKQSCGLVNSDDVTDETR